MVLAEHTEQATLLSDRCAAVWCKAARNLLLRRRVKTDALTATSTLQQRPGRKATGARVACASSPSSHRCSAPGR